MQELARLDMLLNVKKSACTRVGGCFNAKCANTVTREGHELSWLIAYDTLGFYIESVSSSKCSLDAASVVHSTRFLGKLDELPQMK